MALQTGKPRRPKDVSAEDIRFHILRVMEPHRGEANAISLESLCDQVAHALNIQASYKYWERVVRDHIEWLREFDDLGCWICSKLDDGGGRFLATSHEELDRHLEPDRSRFRNGLRRVAAQERRSGLRRAKRQNPQQLAMKLEPIQPELFHAAAH